MQEMGQLTAAGDIYNLDIYNLGELTEMNFPAKRRLRRPSSAPEETPVALGTRDDGLSRGESVLLAQH